ncbi:MAG: hypothetical protein ACOCYE_11835 [Pseudomonadota bacterium]
MITREALRRLVGAKAEQRGLDYVREGRVVELDEVSREELVARVQGARGAPYRQRIRLKRDRAGRIVALDGHCDCPMARNCKHVAAAVIAHAARTSTPSPSSPSLPPAVAAWLNHLQDLDLRSAARRSPVPSGPKREVLIYVLGTEPDRPFAIRPMRVNVKKDGTLGQSARLYDPDRLLWHEPPAFVSEEDHRILRRSRLLGLGPAGFGRQALGVDDELAELFDRIVATGRGRWRDAHGPALASGAERTGRVVWRQADDGDQQAVLEDGDGAPLAVMPARCAAPCAPTDTEGARANDPRRRRARAPAAPLRPRGAAGPASLRRHRPRGTGGRPAAGLCL